ncbi:MAG: MFS transporter [Armatimonadetes bacterium]|nr:MFS transporter [Armatimonadota bacterium]MDW8029812.1 MFS transporter [Armatimonadota bacterium]
MSSDGSERGRSQELRLSVACALLFAAIAPIVGYLNLYLQRRGLSDAQIGTTAAVMSLMSIFAPPLWGYLSDLWNDRRLPIAIASIVSAIIFVAYFVTPFPYVLIVAMLFAFFNMPLIPLLDALVLESLGANKERYGRIRAWGSWAFIAMMFFFGLTLKGSKTDESLVPALSSFIFLRLCLFAISLSLPRNGGGKTSENGDWKEVLNLFTDKEWLAFLTVSLLSMVSTSVFYAFFPLYLNRVGISDNWQGYFWVIAVLAEVAFMTWLSEPLTKRIGLKGVLLLGIAGRTLRFGAYALSLSFPILIALQTLHSLTFAAVHTASVTWVGIKAPSRARALTQTLYTSALMGIGSALGAQIGGFIAEHWGLKVLFGLAGLTNGLAFLLGLLILKEPSLTAEEDKQHQREHLRKSI